MIRINIRNGSGKQMTKRLKVVTQNGTKISLQLRRAKIV